MKKLQSNYDYTINDTTIHVDSKAKIHSGLALSDYDNLIEGACRSWMVDGIKWLKDRFGKVYRGHLGLLGTALLACYAESRYFDYVPEPSITIRGSRIPINPDIALIINNYELLVLEVKLHHKDDIDLTSQMDDFILSSAGQLRRFGVYLGVIHMFMSKLNQAKSERKPPWLAELVLASRNNRKIYNEIDNIVKNLILTQ